MAWGMSKIIKGNPPVTYKSPRRYLWIFVSVLAIGVTLILANIIIYEGVAGVPVLAKAAFEAVSPPSTHHHKKPHRKAANTINGGPKRADRANGIP
jgi:hypothetical protein